MVREIWFASVAWLLAGCSSFEPHSTATSEPLPECRVDQPIVADCHIHETNTYLHAKSRGAPNTLPPHARADYREREREHRITGK